MSRPDHAVHVDLEVPFHDCDPLGVVWHGRYFQYLEKARTELLRSFTLDIPEVRDLGLRMYVTDVRCRYMFPLRYGEMARVTAWLTAGTPLLRVAYDVHNLTRDRRAARAFTAIATTDGQGNLLTSPPPSLIDRLPVALRTAP